MEGQEKKRITGTQVNKDQSDTWPKILKRNYETYGDRHKAMRHKHFGIWQPYTWKDYYLNVKTLALGFIALGFESGDKVLIIGDNAPQWYYAELAAQADHGISVGMVSDLLPREIKAIAENCEARFAVVEDQEQVDKILEIKDELPWLKKVIYWNTKGLAHYKDPLLMSMGQVIRLGQTYEKEYPGRFEQKVESGKADDVCAIVYTAGTSGPAPKGVVHTYKTMKIGAEHILRLDPWTDQDTLVPYQPPAGMNEQYFAIGCHLLSACTLNFPEAPETQLRDTKEAGPSIVCYNARLWESQAAMVQARMLGADTLQRFLYRKLMPLGFKAADRRFQKEEPDLFRKLISIGAERLLFKSLRRSLGLSRVRICYSTGSILSPETLRFFMAIRIPIKNIYGSTEGGVLTIAKNDDLRLDTTGPVCTGAEVRITGQGEIVWRQPGSFIGYYKNPSLTAQVVKEGWFYSGDRGFLREDGHLIFEDRLTDFLEFKTGEKLAPQWIESRLRFSPYIKDAWVLAGPDRTYASAVIIINYNTVSRWAGQKRLIFSTFTELSQKPEVYQLIKEEVDRINRELPLPCRMKKLVNLHQELDPDEGGLTRSRKLKRVFLESRYQGLIEAVYSGKSGVPIEVPVSLRDGRVGTIKTHLTILSVEGTAL